MVDGESLFIKVLEEEWCMVLDWWMAGEWQSLKVSNLRFNNSNDGYSEASFNAKDCVGDDATVMAKDCAKTEAESKLCLKQDFFQTFEFNGLENYGLGWVGLGREALVRPTACEDEEQRVESGYSAGF
ncbi:hypothetical protein SLE2022_273240 [Rubroshorea leprosula]